MLIDYHSCRNLANSQQTIQSKSRNKQKADKLKMTKQTRNKILSVSLGPPKKTKKKPKKNEETKKKPQNQKRRKEKTPKAQYFSSICNCLTSARKRPAPAAAKQTDT